MSHSTTQTSTYMLAKYSRSYPAATQNQPDASLEWQHYTNPVLRLVLDLKKHSSGQLESARLRVLWSVPSGDPSSFPSEISFEDLELLAFSALPAPNTQAHSLPLKVVYRESVLGVRYLYPFPNPNAVFRRFQITFVNSKDVNRLIDAIYTICPCKANPPLNVTKSMTVQNESTMSTPFVSLNAPYRSLQGPPPSNTLVPSFGPDLTSSSVILPGTLAPQRTSTLNPNDDFIRSLATMISSNLQSISQRDLTNPPLQDISDINSVQADSSPLYQLSQAQLEILISEIIQEEQFMALVEKIASMWRVRALCGV